QATVSWPHPSPPQPRSPAVCCRACRAEIVRGAPALGKPPLLCLAARPGAPFAERLRAYRVAAGQTRLELAERSGVGASTLGPTRRADLSAPGAVLRPAGARAGGGVATG